MESKRCCRCKQERPLADFAKNKTNKKDGLQTMCRECMKAYWAARPRTETEPRQSRKKGQLSAAQLNDLAYTTKNWALQRRACIDPITNSHGIFSVDEWCQSFNLGPAEWKQVKHRMLLLGLALSFEEFGGYYIGKPGDQALVLESRIKRICTEAQTTAASMGALQKCSDWPIVAPRLAEGIANTRLLNAGGLGRALTALGANIPTNFEQKFLEAGNSQD